MQLNERERTVQLFSEEGRINAERYFATLSRAQKILDSIAEGDPEQAVSIYREAFKGASPDTNPMWMDHLLLFRQMQACMVLGLFLHHGYLLHLPGQALYTVFQDRTNQLMYMKNPDEANDIMSGAVYDIALLVKHQQELQREYHPAVQKAIDYINSHNEPLTADQIAQAVELSTGHLNQLFRKYTNKTIHEYLVDYRLQMARLLLLTTEKSVSEIAAELGFASASHLGSLFKTQEGITPRQYRLQQRMIGKVE